MRIVDAQIHIWSGGLPGNQAHRQVTAFTRRRGDRPDGRGRRRRGRDPPAELGPARRRDGGGGGPGVPGPVRDHGQGPAGGARDSRALVATWREQPGNLGLRYGFLRDPERTWIADGTLEWLWAAAEQAGVPIAMLATDSLKEVGEIAERHPGLRLTIDHLGGRGGNTTLKDDAAMAHMPELLALAKYPERGRQGDRRARLFERGVPVHQHAPVPEADLRRVRAGADVLGDGHLARCRARGGSA